MFVLYLGSVLFGMCKFSIFINAVFAVFDLEEVMVEQEAGIRLHFLFLSKQRTWIGSGIQIMTNFTWMFLYF